jgi:hypothetical protein
MRPVHVTVAVVTRRIFTQLFSSSAFERLRRRNTKAATSNRPRCQHCQEYRMYREPAVFVDLQQGARKWWQFRTSKNVSERHETKFFIEVTIILMPNSSQWRKNTLKRLIVSSIPSFGSHYNTYRQRAQSNGSTPKNKWRHVQRGFSVGRDVEVHGYTIAVCRQHARDKPQLVPIC